MPYLVEHSRTASSQGMGTMPCASATSSAETSTGGMSVSGYIRADPGRGRMNMVLPDCSASRVSAGTPSPACLTRRMMECTTWPMRPGGAATSTRASASGSAPIWPYSDATSPSPMPYPGSSSVWNTPPTP